MHTGPGPAWWAILTDLSISGAHGHLASYSVPLSTQLFQGTQRRSSCSPLLLASALPPSSLSH
jgi:hypothetical protein